MQKRLIDKAKSLTAPSETLQGMMKKSKISNGAGFTLIELVIVATIIVVLVAVSSPRFRATFRNIELKDAAYNIGKLIKYGQQRAIIEEKKYKLLFDFEKGAYHLLLEDERVKEAEVTAPIEGESLPGEEVEAVPKWRKITGRFGGYFYLPEGITFKGEADKITFLPNGRCDKISLFIVNQKNKTYKIQTNGRAGYVKISEPEEEE